MDLRLAPAWVVGTDERVVAGHGLGDLARVQCVGGDDLEAGLRRDFAGIAGQHGDLVAAAQQFGKNGCTDKPGSAYEGDVHGNPCVDGRSC
jgi:hypothetical protein